MFLHEYKVQCDYDRPSGRDLRDEAMNTIRSREVRGNEDDAPFTSTAHISADVNEKLLRVASVRDFSDVRRLWVLRRVKNDGVFLSGACKFLDFICVDKKSRVQ